MKKRGVSRRPREGEEDVVEKDEEEGAAAAMDSRENLEYIASVVSHHQEQLRLLGREAAAQAQGEEPGMDYLEFAKRRRFVRRPFFGQGYRDRLGWVLVGLVMLIIGHNYISYTLWNWVRLDSYPIFTVLRYCVHNLFILLSLWSYYRCIFTNPGTIPKTVRQVWHSTVTQFLSRRKEQLELREQHKERQEQVQEQGQQQQQALQGHDGLHDAGQEVQEKEKQGGGGGGGGGGGSRRRRKADEGGAPAESQEHAMEEGQSQSKQANGHHASGVAGADATGVTVGCVGGFLTPEDMLQDAKERDFDGKYRYCRSCELPKPAWVHNCVGLYNYKFFLLFLFHTSIASFISFLGFIPEIINALGLFRNLATIRKAWLFHLVAYSQAAAPPSGVLSSINLFISVFMAVFFWLALGGFFLYHLYLVLHNRTTIESLEKNWREKQRQAQGLRPNIYDRGHKANFLEVFGPRPVDWFLPILS